MDLNVDCFIKDMESIMKRQVFFFFFDLEIEIYTILTHTLFGEGRGDSNLCQMGGGDSLAPLGQMPSGQAPRF